MRLLLLSLQQARETPPGGSTQARRIRIEEDHALALARTMRDGGSIAPLLVCLKGSRLQRMAAAINLPCMAVGGTGGGLSGLLRLWHWQRRHRYLLIQTVGEEAMTLGHRLLRMRKPGSALLSHAFFLRAPEAARCQSREMLAARYILYGSTHVRQRLQTVWENAVGGAKLPDEALLALSPGISDEGFTSAPPFAPDTGQHFIFGMSDSLVPRSGAQTVVRAMAALWQRTDMPPWEVRMLGHGPRFQEVLTEANTLGVAARLCLLGEQNASEVLAGCHAWLAPGSAPDEAPETLWQGFAAGLPVICSAGPLHRERLAPHASPDWPDGPAVMVPEKDAQALARAMIDLMQRADVRADLARRSQDILPLITWQHMAGEACTLFESWLRDLEAARTNSGDAGARPRDDSPQTDPPDKT
ncbi:MAG: glycosyltransferase [Desulfovibrionaceae bacterium]|nr:glycosyltransferase [Desulfovibrionaceae bacterium]